MRDLLIHELDMVSGGNRDLDTDRDGIPDYDDWEPDRPQHPQIDLSRLFPGFFGRKK